MKILLVGVVALAASPALAQECQTPCTAVAHEAVAVVLHTAPTDTGAYQLVRNGVPQPQIPLFAGSDVEFWYLAGLDVGSYTFTILAGGVEVSEPGVLTVQAPSSQTPWHGSPLPLPGVLQAEDYDLGGEGVAYHDTDVANNGGAYRTDAVDIKALVSGSGYQVGWLATGEWLEYTVTVPTAGDYVVEWRVASGDTSAGVHLEVNGVNVSGPVLVPPTGSYDVFTAVPSIVTLPAGSQVWRVVVDEEWFDLDSLTVSALAAPPPVPPPPPPPADPCVTDPLAFSMVRWPSGVTGRQRTEYRSDRAITLTLDLLTQPWRATAQDARGCRVTVTR